MRKNKLSSSHKYRLKQIYRRPTLTLRYKVIKLGLRFQRYRIHLLKIMGKRK